MYMYFAFDQNLRLVAVSRANFPPEPDSKSIAEGRNDAYRMPVIEALREETSQNIIIYSASHETREKELHEQYLVNKQMEKAEGLK